MSSDSVADRPGAPGLAGRRIFVPRGGAAGDRWARAIRERGGEPVVVALTETGPPEDPAALAAAAERWNRGEYDWLVVTSANGAQAIAEAGARPGPALVAAVGPATADALRERGFEVTLQPEHDFSATGLAEALLTVIGGAVPGADGSGADGSGADGRGADRDGEDPAAGSSAGARRLLLPLSEIASTELERALAAAGHAPDRVTAYRTVPAPCDAAREAEIAAGGADTILVLSGSGAAEVAQRFGPPQLPGGAPLDGAPSGAALLDGALPGGALLAAIGEPTARALATHGLRADVVAARHTIDGLLDALAERLADPAPRQAPPPAGSGPAASGPAAPEPALPGSVPTGSAPTDSAATDPARPGGTPA